MDSGYSKIYQLLHFLLIIMGRLIRAVFSVLSLSFNFLCWVFLPYFSFLKRFLEFIREAKWLFKLFNVANCLSTFYCTSNATIIKVWTLHQSLFYYAITNQYVYQLILLLQSNWNTVKLQIQLGPKKFRNFTERSATSRRRFEHRYVPGF